MLADIFRKMLVQFKRSAGLDPNQDLCSSDCLSYEHLLRF